jgi:hypothetical protein
MLLARMAGAAVVDLREISLAWKRCENTNCITDHLVVVVVGLLKEEEGPLHLVGVVQDPQLLHTQHSKQHMPADS